MKARLPDPNNGALTLPEVLLIVAVLAVVAGLLVPALIATRRPARTINCVNNVKQVGLSFRVWANDNNERFPMQVSVTNGGTMEFVQMGIAFPHFRALSNELNTPRILHCPKDYERTNAWNFTSDLNDWKISYFVGVDAEPDRPETLLCGDRNLSIAGKPAPRRLVTLSSGDAVGWTSQMHSSAGNIALADGSVHQVNGQRLREFLAKSGLTNRLAIP